MMERTDLLASEELRLRREFQDKAKGSTESSKLAALTDAFNRKIGKQ
jgi:hypothetical protein